MKADEMFEKLGYKKAEFDYYTREMPDVTIHFKDKWKEVFIMGSIEAKELQAINKKCEELGWLDEDNRIIE